MSRHPKLDLRHLLVCTAIAAAAALSMSAPAFAADPPAPAPAPAAQQKPAACANQEPVTGTHIRRDCDATTLETITVFGGAELGPGDAQWTDDDASVPELPMTRTAGR